MRAHPPADLARGAHVVAPHGRYEHHGIERARSRLGERRYRVLTNNCEHFCMWCLTGASHSRQVRRVLARPHLGLLTAAWLLPILIGELLRRLA